MSGMTAEMLDGLDGGIDAGTGAGEAAGDQATALAATAGEATPATAETATGATEVDSGSAQDAAVDAGPTAFDQMKEYLRAQRMENAELRSKMELLERRVATPPAAPAAQEQPKYRVLYDEDGNEVRIPLQQAVPAADAATQTAAAESPRFLQLRENLQQINQQKGPVLETLYEVVLESPKYPDAATVLQKKYFDDLFEAIATERARETKAPYEEALLETQIAVWRLPNPYKYMYDALTKHHPAFAKKQEPAAQAQVPKAKEPPTVPTSLADMGVGTADAGTGWTAAKLDAMSEVELNKVPQDVIDKWLRNELK